MKGRPVRVSAVVLAIAVAVIGWLAPPPPPASALCLTCFATLTVTPTGDGTGSAITSDGFIDCRRSLSSTSGTCAHVYAVPTGNAVSVELTWTASLGSTLCCPQGYPEPSDIYFIEIPVGSSSVQSYAFTATPETLSVAKSGTGTGTVTSAPAGISCGTDCIGTFGWGIPFMLTAIPDPGSVFQYWTGPCEDQEATCTAVISSNASTTAFFALAPPLPSTAPPAASESAPPSSGQPGSSPGAGQSPRITSAPTNQSSQRLSQTPPPGVKAFAAPTGSPSSAPDTRAPSLATTGFPGGGLGASPTQSGAVGLSGTSESDSNSSSVILTTLAIAVIALFAAGLLGGSIALEAKRRSINSTPPTPPSG